MPAARGLGFAYPAPNAQREVRWEGRDSISNYLAGKGLKNLTVAFVVAVRAYFRGSQSDAALSPLFSGDESTTVSLVGLTVS
jgi:hypothetical protein